MDKKYEKEKYNMIVPYRKLLTIIFGFLFFSDLELSVNNI